MRAMRTTGAIGLLMTMGMTACSASDAEPLPVPVEIDGRQKASETRPDPNVALLRKVAGSADYDIQPSVSALEQLEEYALLGKVVAWHEGPMHDLGGIALTYAVMETEVEQTFKSADGDASRRYTLVLQGALPVDERGEVIPRDEKNGRYAALSIDELKRAVPSGTRVIVLANELKVEEVDDGEMKLKILRDWEGKGDTPLLYPHSQGLLFEMADGGYESGGRAEQEEVAIKQWPASPDYRGAIRNGAFDALRRELADE